MSARVFLACYISALFIGAALGSLVTTIYVAWRRRNRRVRTILPMVRRNSLAGQRRRDDLWPLRVSGNKR